MKNKRIIPCLDVCGGQVVKGVNFVGFREVGDPIECAAEYVKQGADEIVLLDITATNEGRGTIIDLVRETAKHVSVPLTVGGGIRSLEDIRKLMQAGADKVSVNTAAIKRPELLREAASEFGKERVVLAIDARKTGDGKYNVIINGGKTDTGMDLVDWVKEGESLGAGEILLTSMDADGMKSGFDIPMLSVVCNSVKIPVIASGGCGRIDDFIKVFQDTACDAALAASIFHFGELTVGSVKEELIKNGISVSFTGEGECGR